MQQTAFGCQGSQLRLKQNLLQTCLRILQLLSDTITAANEAHVAKEKALSEVQALKLAAEKEHAAFEEEWRQLSHIIEEDRCEATWSWAGLMPSDQSTLQQFCPWASLPALHKRMTRHARQAGMWRQQECLHNFCTLHDKPAI